MKRFIFFVGLFILLVSCQSPKPQVTPTPTVVLTNTPVPLTPTNAPQAPTLVPSTLVAEGTEPFHWIDGESYPPLISRGADGKPTGIFYGIMTEAFRRLGIPLKVDLYPWARAQKILTEGAGDGMVTVLTEERKQYFIGSDPILLVAEQIFANKDNPRIDEIMAIRSLKELQSFSVVETVGSGWTKENLQDVEIIWVPDMDNAFSMLVTGRADIYIANGYTGADFIGRKIENGEAFSKGYRSIITNPYPLRTLAFRLLVRKGSPYVGALDDFNHVIHQMQIDGTIQYIIEGEGLPHLDNDGN